jgi:acetyl-CoA carboxylase biotin carboxyl carrier protein
MKAKEIQELLDFISQSGLAEVNIETEQFKLAVKKYQESNLAPAPVYHAPVVHTSIPAAVPAAVPTAPASADTAKTEAPAADTSKNLITIKSPMIGTFYRSPNPDSPSFVNVGDEISPGKPVCIIEAMKLFNEIESEVSGRVVKILVENASPVEYDQPLFLIEPK